MHIHRSYRGFALLVASFGALASFVPELPLETSAPEPLQQRQAAITTQDPPTRTMSRDPWECLTENITQYFDFVPKPTGAVLSDINSFGYEVAAPCRATATGLGRFSCTVSDPRSWCGFTTFAAPDVLSSYSTYLSAAVSFCTEKSSTMSVLSTSCPVAWARPDPAQHEWHGACELLPRSSPKDRHSCVNFRGAIRFCFNSCSGSFVIWFYPHCQQGVCGSQQSSGVSWTSFGSAGIDEHGVGHARKCCITSITPGLIVDIIKILYTKALQGIAL